MASASGRILQRESTAKTARARREGLHAAAIRAASFAAFAHHGIRPPPFQEEREAERADDRSDGGTIALPDVLVEQDGNVETIPVDALEEFEKTVRPSAPLPAGVEEEDLHQGKPDGPLGDTPPPAIVIRIRTATSVGRQRKCCY